MRWLKLDPTLTATRFLLTVSSRIEVIAIARLADVGLIPVLSMWSVELVLALVTVDTFRVVLAVFANTASFVVSMDIERKPFGVNLLGVLALTGMSVAVARFALEWTSIGILAPFLLLESGAAFGTLDAAGIVLTLAGQDARRRTWVQHVTGVCVTIAHTSSTDGNILDRVEVTSGNRRILPSNGHQVSKQILRSQEAYAYIRGTTPFLERRRVEVIVRRWTII